MRQLQGLTDNLCHTTCSRPCNCECPPAAWPPCSSPCLSPKPQAQYPNRPICFIVPYTPGGTVEILAQAISPALHQALGQPIFIENRPGAGGNIGAESTPPGIGSASHLALLQFGKMAEIK
jgi:hypothetical protein